MIKKGYLILTLAAVALVFLSGASDLQAVWNGAPQTDMKNDLQAGKVKNYTMPEPKEKFAPGEILVKFKGVVPAKSIGPDAEAGVMVALSAPAHEALKMIQANVKKVHPMIGVLHVQLPAHLSVGQGIESLYRSGAVEYAEPNFQVRAMARTPFRIQATPNDPRFAEQWGLRNVGQEGGTADADIDAPEAWNSGTSGTGVVTVVIDTGVDYNHEDLAANMWKNPGEIPGNSKDDDGNGYIDDVYGIDRDHKDSDPMDDHGHGTHCSGIIGGRGNNGKGVAGVNWTAKIMALKFLDSFGSGWTSDAITCMEYALAIQAKRGYRMVWSNSWSGGGYTQSLYDTIALARDKGIIFVAAAGNDKADTDVSPSYPAAYDLPNIISVGASDRFDNCASFSAFYGTNYGLSSVDLFAPGVAILSSLPGNSYAEWSGTSMACPHVSGAIARVWTKLGSTYNWKQIKGIVLNGTENGETGAFANKCVTGGRLNLFNSIQAAIADDPAVFSVTPSRANTGDAITLLGVNFGATKTTLSFQGVNFKEADIVSWTDEKIVAKVSSVLPKGYGMVQVTTAAGISRGAAFGKLPAESMVGRTNVPRGWAAHAQVGNNTWLISGNTYWGQTGLVEKYNLSTNRSVIDSGWMIPTTVSNAGAAAIGSKIFVVGGYNKDTKEVYDLLQIFDTTVGTWTYGKKLPAKVMQLAVVAYNSKIYVFGGLDGYEGNVLKKAYVYDPAINAWSTLADMPTATAYAAGVKYGARIWVMGGFYGYHFGNELKTVQEYDPAANTWTAKPDLIKRRGGAAANVYGNKVFCLHGAGASSSKGNTDSEYYAVSAWINDIYGTDGVYTPGTGKYLNKIYSLGGYLDTLKFSNNVWRFTSP